MQSTGRLLVEGGLLDQPYIFMREYKVCSDLITLFDALRKINQQSPP
jgi:hypothetical protein